MTDWKKRLNLNSYEWWRNHRRVITFGGFLFLFSVYLNPVIEQARQSNKNTVYLLVLHNLYNTKGSPPTWLVPMKSMEQCKKAGEKILQGENLKGYGRYIFSECVEGK